jgi:hypothetical protein
MLRRLKGKEYFSAEGVKGDPLQDLQVPEFSQK